MAAANARVYGAEEDWGFASRRCCRYVEAGLVWCDRCASWRTKLNKKTGYCCICDARDRLSRHMDECLSELSRMSLRNREIYESEEARREPRKHVSPPKPPCRSAYDLEEELNLLEVEYLKKYEQWERAKIERQIDAAKQRKCRMRKKNGTNPRLGKIADAASEGRGTCESEDEGQLFDFGEDFGAWEWDTGDVFSIEDLAYIENDSTEGLASWEGAECGNAHYDDMREGW